MTARETALLFAVVIVAPAIALAWCIGTMIGQAIS